MITKTSGLPVGADDNTQRTSSIDNQPESYEDNPDEQRRTSERAEYEQELSNRDSERARVEAEQKAEQVRKDAEDKSSKDAERKRAFEAEQSKWNVNQRLKAKDEEYTEEQKQVLKTKELRPITPKTVAEKAGKVGKKLIGDIFGKKKQPESKDTEQLAILREKNRHAENMQKLRNQTSGGQRMSKPARGQFKAPSGVSKYIDPFPRGGGGSGGFPSVDPMGGMKAGKNMMDISFVMPGSRTPAIAKPQAPPRPSPRPTQNPMGMFSDPFKGLPKATQPGKMPTAKGNPMVLPVKGKGKKKPGWMDF